MVVSVGGGRGGASMTGTPAPANREHGRAEHNCHNRRLAWRRAARPRHQFFPEPPAMTKLTDTATVTIPRTASRRDALKMVASIPLLPVASSLMAGSTGLLVATGAMAKTAAKGADVVSIERKRGGWEKRVAGRMEIGGGRKNKQKK